MTAVLLSRYHSVSLELGYGLPNRNKYIKCTITNIISQLRKGTFGIYILLGIWPPLFVSNYLIQSFTIEILLLL